MLTGLELIHMGEAKGERTQELLEKKQKYISKGISNAFPILVDEAKGAVVKDIDGNIYLDFYGGIGVLNAGHCPEPVVDAIKAQAEKLLHTCFMTAMYDSYIELAEKLCQIAPGSGPKKAFFVNSGAEAVENAVKVARAYTKRPAVIAFDSAFHGRTFLTMTLTSKVKPYKYGFGPFAPEVYKVPSANCYRCMYQSTYPGCGMHCLEYFHKFFKAEVDPDFVAGMIIEPVQGEGGFIVPPPEFLPGLKKICEDYGILFIADEVQTGFCRTGRIFAVENYGVEPDLMTVAKSLAAGMPLSAVIGKLEIMDALDPGYVGGTFAGNPVSCAAGLATIEYMEKNNLCQRATKMGQIIVDRMKKLQEKLPQIGDIRSLGSMIGIELVKDAVTKEPAKDETSRIQQKCFEKGLLIIGAGILGNVIRLLMPLNITDEQLEQGLNILEEACEDVF